MENEKNMSGGQMNTTCNHGCHHDHKHMMKWAIRIALLAVVFLFAFKMGELKGMLESHGEYYGHRYYGGGMMGVYPADGGYTTYGNDVGAPDVGQAIPPTATTPAPKK